MCKTTRLHILIVSILGLLAVTDYAMAGEARAEHAAIGGVKAPPPVATEAERPRRSPPTNGMVSMTVKTAATAEQRLVGLINQARQSHEELRG